MPSLLCCKCNKNIDLELQVVSNKEVENIIIYLLKSYNINSYTFNWQTNKLPCKTRFLEDLIQKDIQMNIYNSVDITINTHYIAITYDDNPFSVCTTYFNIY